MYEPKNHLHVNKYEVKYVELNKEKSHASQM